MPTTVWMALVLAAAPTEQFKELTRRSLAEYDAGAYAKALADFQAAYALDPRPALLFDLGQCQRALGNHRKAALAYERFLHEVPNARNKAQAEALYAQMAELALRDEQTPEARAAPSPALPPAPSAAVTAPAGRRHIRAGAWWLGGSGIGVAVVGTILFALAESTLGNGYPTPVGGVVENHLSASTFFGATTEGNVGEVLWCVGGALLVGGGVVALTGGSR